MADVIPFQPTRAHALDRLERAGEIGVLVTMAPQTREQFDQIVVALGGLAECSFSSYADPTLHGKIADVSVLVRLNALDEPEPRPDSPFIAELKVALEEAKS